VNSCNLEAEKEKPILATEGQNTQEPGKVFRVTFWERSDATPLLRRFKVRVLFFATRK
jgi:hypothetical protein